MSPVFGTGLAVESSAMGDKVFFTISEITEELGITLRTARFYEQRGLLRPARLGKNRTYSKADRERLKEIVILRKLGFTIAEIKGSKFDLAKFKQQLAFARQQRAEIDEIIVQIQRKIDELVEAKERSEAA
ncbi:MerR family transcriptional regulator [Bosea sp. F3-2]|uniref:MerR family transcriptional regulator n=1 Tax=Bosea sp. F3-2 TaxID=2599640 RepID=UPI0011ECF711|nr:MerR family transcriptional regulator [Bosea sp. F3-2]QEL23764.1 MerR family transcriptional regulator [Bosea sp. F3-2]